MQRLWLLAGLMGVLALPGRPAYGDDHGLFQQPLWRPSEPPATGYSTPTIPLESLDPALRERVRAVLDKSTLTARSGQETFNTRPAIYRYLLDHPDHAVKLWRQLGAQVSDIDDQGGGHYLWKDGRGSEVRWEIGLRGKGGLHLWYAEGKIKPGMLLPAQSFRAVALLQFTEGVDTKGLPAIRHQVYFVLRCDSRAIALATRLMGHSAPRLTESYLGQLLAFYGGLAWYIYQDDDRARNLFEQVGLRPLAPASPSTP
jgi:hypothetical protein